MHPYLIRESARAKGVRLKYTFDDGLVVVVPRGYNLARIPSIISQEQAWIEKARREAQARRQALAEIPPPELPTVITLRALGEELDVAYADGVSAGAGKRPGTATTGKAKGSRGPRPVRALQAARTREAAGVLTVGAASSDQAAVVAALRRWTARKARSRLVPWLSQLSAETGLAFSRSAVRGQRTRWASCSAAKTISINHKLLFVPALLVEYVFVHELCHTAELNHSRRFWNLVGRYEPDYKRLDRELKCAWRYVPWWLCDPGSGELNQSHWPVPGNPDHFNRRAAPDRARSL